MNKKSIDEILNIFLISLYILTILQNEPMTASQIEDTIYENKHAFIKVNNESILKAFSELIDWQHIELLEDQNLFTITESGLDEYWEILNKITGDDF